MKWKRFCIGKRRNKGQGGYLLTETVIGLMIVAGLAAGISEILHQTALVEHRIRTRSELLQGGRYARQFLAGRVRASAISPAVTGNGHMLTTRDGAVWTFVMTGGQMYRKMLNGALQPLTGVTNERKRSRISVETTEGNAPFAADGGLIDFRWDAVNGSERYPVRLYVLPDRLYFGGG